MQIGSQNVKIQFIKPSSSFATMLLTCQHDAGTHTSIFIHVCVYLLYGSETWRLTENNKRRIEATEMDDLRRSSRISRKERIRNVTIRQQIGLEETIVKEIEQNQLTWYGHVQRMVEGRLPKIALKWMPKQKTARGRPKKNWIGRYKEGHEGKKPK